MKQLSMPAFNNDEIIIPSFIAKKRGVFGRRRIRLQCYQLCETAVPGKWGYRCTGMSYMNPKVLWLLWTMELISIWQALAPSFGHLKIWRACWAASSCGQDLRHLTRMSVIVEFYWPAPAWREVPDITLLQLRQMTVSDAASIWKGERRLCLWLYFRSSSRYCQSIRLVAYQKADLWGRQADSGWTLACAGLCGWAW